MTATFPVMLCLVALLAAPATAPSGPTTLAQQLSEFDRKIVEELRAVNPEAVPIFVEANETRAREDHRRAADLYARVVAMAPGFSHALRRQAHEEIALGHRVEAIGLARRAVAIDRSAENLSSLASVLASGTTESLTSPLEKAEALSLAKQAEALQPDDGVIQMILCQAAIAGNDLATLRGCATKLQSIAPEEMGTHYYLAILAASEGRLDAAAVALERAHQLGLPDDAYKAFGDSLSVSRQEPPPWYSRLLPAASVIAGGWAGALLLLLAAGWMLSRAALRASGRVPAEATGRAKGLDATLRRVYAGVLWLCCAFYYVSIPLLVASVVLLGGGLVYSMLVIGHIPIKLLLIVGALTLTSLLSIARSLFVRGSDQQPGLPLTLDAQPRLRSLLDEVAGRVGTKPVEAVYLTPGTDVAVMERGGMLGRLRGGRERCLILGVGVIDGMRIGPFKAVLAHEYGHFSNRDTAGGGFALAVRRSMFSMATHLARGGAATWFNPAWLFVNAFYRAFLRISQGASRLQEVLADRWAAFLYGSEAFEQGLRHVIERSVRFRTHLDGTLKEVVDGKLPLANLYTYSPKVGPPERAMQEAIDQALNAAPSPYDSHPSPADRFTWVRTIGAAGSGRSIDDDAEVWSLFADREDLERRLTDQVRQNVALLYKVQIPAAG